MERNCYSSSPPNCPAPIYHSNGFYKTEQINSDLCSFSNNLNVNKVEYIYSSHAISDYENSKSELVLKIEPQESTNSNCISYINDEDANDINQQSDQNFITCRVCGDKASGYHYGVTSCEGCKGFFRRSMQKQIEYRCLRDGKCQVMRLNRNRCQYCRFKKCVAVGMSRDSVRYGRVPKRIPDIGSLDESFIRYTTNILPSNSILSSNQIGCNFVTSEDELALLEAHQLAIYDIILIISGAHATYCDETEDKLSTLQKRSSSLLKTLSTDFSESMGLESCRCSMFECIAELITPSINKIVEFAKRIPDFQNLTQDDQLTLIKSGFFEITLLRTCCMYNYVDNTFLFSDGSIVPRAELEVIYSVDFINALFEFSQHFIFLGLNDTEVGLMVALVIASPERIGLSDINAVRKLHDQIFEALKMQLHRNHPLNLSLTDVAIAKLPTLRILNTVHSHHLDWYRVRWKMLINLPPLFAEIYDISRQEDEEKDNDSNPDQVTCDLTPYSAVF